MDTQAFRESAQERINLAETQRQYHEGEAERLGTVVTSLRNYLANETEDAPGAGPSYPSPVVIPPTDRTASSILMPFVRENPNLTRDDAHRLLLEAGYPIKGNKKKVVANSLSMTHRKLREESGETETETATEEE